ncbi:hypothetical protein Nit79A3_1069 [Nitrosomonas sp. Is79A3]
MVIKCRGRQILVHGLVLALFGVIWGVAAPHPRPHSIRTNRPSKNLFEAAVARQKQAKKRSLCLLNEHFATAAAMQIVFQCPIKRYVVRADDSSFPRAAA